MAAIRRWFRDPPPALGFELSESGIAMGRPGAPPRMVFQPLEPGVLSVSPLKDNVVKAEELAAQVRALAGARESRKRHDAVLILPDGSVRVLVLDFDAFPSDPAEQLSLVQFRIRKGLPFDLDSAALSYAPQPSNGKRMDVVAAVAPLEIVARYEALFRAGGLVPSWVTTSTLAALELVRESGVAVMVKRSGRFLTISVLADGALKLLRSIELVELSLSEVLTPLYPTVAYVEDQLGVRPDKLLLCGFGSGTEELQRACERELAAPAEALTSRYGEVQEHNAGLLGWLESLISGGGR